MAERRSLNLDPGDSQGALRGNTGPISQDPSALTTQQLLRENFWLRELLESKLLTVDQRLESSDKAVLLLQAFADRTPTTMDVQNQVLQLREVTMEKFDGIKNQFSALEVQTDKASRDVKSAVDAAFAAAKEAVGEQNKSSALAIAKSEANLTKQLDMQGEANKTNMLSIEDKINGMKERITIIESKTSVSDPSSAIAIARLDAAVTRLSTTTDVSAGRRTGAEGLWAFIVGGLGLLFGLGAFVAMLMKAF